MSPTSLRVEVDAGSLWRQTRIPVLFLDTRQKRLLVKLPYAPDNRAWLKDAHVRHPEWVKRLQSWQIPRAWLEEATRRLCLRYGCAYLIQPYRDREVCAPACWDAQGLECTCSCLGANHGQGEQGAGWYILSDTCALRWGERVYACRLLRVGEVVP